MARQTQTVRVDPASRAVEPFWVWPSDDLRLIIEPRDKKRHDIAWSEIVKQSMGDTVLWHKTSHAADADIYDVANAFPGTEFMSVKGSLTTRGGGGGGPSPIFQVTVPEVDIDWDIPGYRENSAEPGEDTRMLWIGSDSVYPFLVRRPIEETDDMMMKIGATWKRPLPDLEFYSFSNSGLLVYATEADALAGVNAITSSRLIPRETWNDASVRYLRFFAKQNPAQQTLPQMMQEIKLKRIDRNNGNPTPFEGDVSGVSYDSIKYRLLRPDIDVDTNNDGTIDPLIDGEDKYELYEPGLLLDRFDEDAEASGQLKEIKLSGFPQGMGLNAKLTKTGTGGLLIYLGNNLTSQKLQPGTVWTDANPPPQSLWVQGRDTNGKALLRFEIFDPATPTEILAADEVCLTVLEPASYSPSGSDFYSVWFPLNPVDGAPSLPENNMTLSRGNLDAVIEKVCMQGGAERQTVVMYTDISGDQDLVVGDCTPVNLRKMADAGILQVYTHGFESYLCAAFAAPTSAGKNTLETIYSGISGSRFEIMTSKSSTMECYTALIPSSWFETEWKQKVNANKSIVVWDVCHSANSNGSLKSLMDAAEGRWRIGYTGATANVICYLANESFFGNLSGHVLVPDATRRTAGRAFVPGDVNPITRMSGNPWTTLCPSPIVLPTATFVGTHPGAEQKGWGCIVFDTYVRPEGSAADALDGSAKAYLSNIKWVNIGDGCRVIGFDYDFTKGAAGTGPTLIVEADSIVGQGNGGGQWLDGDGRLPNKDDKQFKLY